MSAGPFEIATYETSSLALGGVTMPIRIQPETRGLSIGGNGNDGGAAAPDFPLRVSVSATRGEYGVKPRKVTVRFIDRAAAIAVGYTGDDLTIPVLLAANEINYTPGATGTYLGRAIQVISFTPESFR